MGDDMKKVYLIGYMGCGKSAIGKRLSFATKMPFYDMDTEIVRMTGLTIPQIFEMYGEEYFREMETEFLRTFRDEYCIIATGGGVAMRKENREIMRKTGLVFFLNAPFRDIWRRISTDRNRPIVQRSTRTDLESYLIIGNLIIYMVLILKSKRKIDRCVKLWIISHSKLVGLKGK